MNDKYFHILKMIDDLINEFGKAKTARKLYISRVTLYNWIKDPSKITIQNVLDLTRLHTAMITFRRSLK